ncbi:cytochrome P450 [Nocardioides bruguierae]|uniref:Cytochrome P450 n=1 Tax=Nocardioides bruguierae TaxID=2945102 RepID=A0A9X2IHE6_9ACTN|nr:cytochrome P450 [Nocardioides bruguierae]MCM0622524.1 cytochrome P450 [Nocardioides bruguierae]
MSVKYDPLSPRVIANPYPVYDALRRSDPVHWHEQMGAYVLTRHSDCQTVLRDHGTFARDARRVGAEIPDRFLQVQTDDPPNNAKLRSALRNLIGGEDAADSCAREASVLVQRLRETGDQPLEVMRQVVAPAALTVTCDLLGVPSPGVDEYMEIFDGITRAMDAKLDPDRSHAGISATLRLGGYMAEWMAQAANSSLVGQARDAGIACGAPPHYVENTLAAAFNAGFSTLYALTGEILLELCRPELLSALQACDYAVAADEFLRYSSPAQGTMRYVTKTHAFEGGVVERGQAVVVLFSAANRDASVFDRPHDIVLTRTPNRHLGFGWGAHVCAGTPLGKQWVQSLLRALGEVHIGLELTEAPTYMHSATLRNLESLRISARPRKGL